MTDKLLSVGGAILMSTALFAQSPASSAKPDTAAPPAQQAAASADGTVAVNGCVYRVTDDPKMFALQRTSDADTTGTQTSNANPAAGANVRGAVGTTGTTTMTPGGAAGTGTAANAGPMWYRLTDGDAAELANFAGKAVRINGMITSGTSARDAGAGQRDQLAGATLKAADLESAPALMVHEITGVEGQCKTATAVPDSNAKQ
jgi:hypothetical protein